MTDHYVACPSCLSMALYFWERPNKYKCYECNRIFTQAEGEIAFKTIPDPYLKEEMDEEARYAQAKAAHGHLHEPKGYRSAKPRCCATCKLHTFVNGTCACLRPNGPEYDAGDMEQWFNVCDYWKDEDK